MGLQSHPKACFVPELSDQKEFTRGEQAPPSKEELSWSAIPLYKFQLSLTGICLFSWTELMIVIQELLTQWFMIVHAMSFSSLWHSLFKLDWINKMTPHSSVFTSSAVSGTLCADIFWQVDISCILKCHHDDHCGIGFASLMHWVVWQRNDKISKINRSPSWVSYFDGSEKAVSPKLAFLDRDYRVSVFGLVWCVIA